VTLIVENGTGVFGANTYEGVAYVTAYLTARGRQTENGWSTSGTPAQEAACLASTAHIERRFSLLFKGSKQFLDISRAKGTWVPTQNPADTETVTIGATVYRFVNTLALANDVLIGSTLSSSIDNLIAAVSADVAGAGVTYHASTTANADAAAEVFHDDTMLVYALATGTSGNAVALASSQALNPWLNSATFLTGGSDVVRPQPLSFPRRGLTDRDGVLIVGIPDRLKFAFAEYAVRARAAVLAPDPTADERGGILPRFVDVTGPLRTELEFVPGTAGVGRIPDYPEADRLLSEYVKSNAGVLR